MNRSAAPSRHSSSRSRSTDPALGLPEPREVPASERIPHSHRAAPTRVIPTLAIPTRALPTRSTPAHAATSPGALFVSMLTGALLAGSGVVLTAVGHEAPPPPQGPDAALEGTLPVGLSRPEAAQPRHALAAPRVQDVPREVPAPAARVDAARGDDVRGDRAAEASSGVRTGSPTDTSPATRPGSSPSARTGPVADAAPRARTIMIIRHGEKPSGKGSGVDASGRPDTHSLTTRGWSRANGIAKLFAGPEAPTRPGLARPKTIFAASANDQGEGTRTRETVSPLAKKLGVPVNSTFGKGQEAQLAQQAAAASKNGPVLISWQHGEIPAIADAFKTVGPTPPEEWPDSRFDMVWTLTDTGNGWKFSQAPEMVLPGDSGQTFR